ncbi:MAG: ATP-binding protein [Bacteroidota bacterium]|jgi:two-component system NarL family sensor kinase
MNSWILLHTHSVIAFIIAVTQLGMTWFLFKSRARIPIRKWLILNYIASSIWYLDQMVRFSLYPGTEGSWVYKIETVFLYGPVLVAQMLANLQIYYQFIEAKFDMERKLVMKLMVPFSIFLVALIGWNEFYNNSDIYVFQVVSFLWGIVSNVATFLIAIRKAFIFRGSNTNAYRAHLIIAGVSTSFFTLSIICVIFGLYSVVGYWTYFIFVWLGEICLIITYLYFSEVFVSFQVKITGYSFVSVVLFLTICALIFFPPTLPDEIEKRFAQQEGLKKIFVLFLVATSLIIFLLPSLLRATLTNPLKQVLRAIRKVNSDNLNVQLPVKYQDEIGLLTTNFNTMTATLRQAKIRLEEYTRVLGELYNNQQKVQEQTLNHVSQEIHDNVGQLLSLVRMQLNQVAEKGGAENKLIIDAQDNIGRAMRDLRDMARGMSSDRIKLLGLFGSVEQEAQRIQRTGACEVNTHCEGSIQSLDHQREIILFRVIQESLQNVFKHAKASRIDISFHYQPHLLKIQVIDNGEGFVPEKKQKGSGLGLMNMQHRVQLAGGELSLETKEGEGTKVSILIPLL